MKVRPPVCKICRREGVKLYLKGSRCRSVNCPIEKHRPATSGYSRFSSRDSNYRVQLREKEKVRAFYGVMERQFRRYFDLAKASGTAPGERLLILLERRLDNLLLVSGLVVSRRFARQLISNGHIRVNGRRVSAASYLVEVGDEVDLRPGSSLLASLKERLASGGGAEQVCPAWLTVDKDAVKVKAVREPSRSEVTIPVEEGRIVGLYSR